MEAQENKNPNRNEAQGLQDRLESLWNAGKFQGGTGVARVLSGHGGDGFASAGAWEPYETTCALELNEKSSLI